MLISLDWLKEYVDINEDVKELENALTMIGQEVEAIEEQGKYLDNIVVGKIEEYGKHPDAEKLTLLKVNVGTQENLQIVCGAQNHKLGDKVVVAKIGAVLPEDFKIKKTKIRGVESHGMLCSEKELGMGEAHEGIIILPEDAPVGQDIREYLEQNDVIFELEITPNRPDCLSHIGIAREVAAYYDRKVKYPTIDLNEVTETIYDNIHVEIEDKERCKRYTARIVKNVKVEESPEWLKRRLKAVGIRPINNVVDITNYIMMEYNHPMHAFDLKKIEGKKIIVRSAKKGEKLTTLDGVERELKEELVIADENKTIAIAGIMGGENTEVDSNTTDILLEVAHFSPENIRKTSKAIGLSSESSYRFERGVDRENSDTVINRAAYLMQEISGGSVLSGIESVYVEKPEKPEININIDKLNKFIGKTLDIEEVGKILTNLELEIKNFGENTLTVVPPSYREDLTRTADLYEEVIRMYGFENIEDKLPEESIRPGKKDSETLAVDSAKMALVELGLQEVINYSFIPENSLEKIKIESDVLRIKNPINEEMVVMRPTLTYSVLANIRDNFNRNIFDLEIFEVSRIFTPADELANEEVKVAIALGGKPNRDLWNPKPESYNFYDIKGYVESFLDIMGMSRYQLNRSQSSIFHPGRSADICVGKNVIGTFGEIHPDVAEAMEIEKEKVYAAELDLSKILKYAKNKIKYKKIVKFPAVTRDLAVVLDSEILVGDMLTDINKSSDIIENVELFDIYEGERIESGKKSVAMNIVMRSDKGTLAEEEVNKSIEIILGIISKKYNGEIRQ